MIPAIGTMIAAYIGFRMVEIFCFPDNRYTNRSARVLLAIFAILVAVVVFFCWLSLITSGTGMPKP